MRKSALLANAIAITFGAGQVFAQGLPTCNSVTVLSDSSIAAAVTSKMVCVGSPSVWNNQEYHATGGSIVDYKHGSAPGKDPTKTIGSWATSGGAAGVITYTYTPGPTIGYMVSMSGSTLYFCAPGAGTLTLVATGTIEPSSGTIGAAQACI